MPTKKKVTKKKVGVPSTYKKKYCEELIAHMATGLSFETFAATINTNRNTLFKWEKKYDDFSDAKKLGREKNQMFWENLGRAGAAGKLQGFNCGAWIFNMKNRCNWRDKHEIEAIGSGALHVVIDKEDESL